MEMHTSNGSLNNDPVDVLLPNDMDVMDDMHESHHRRSSYHHRDDDNGRGVITGVDGRLADDGERASHEREREREHESSLDRGHYEGRDQYNRDNKYDNNRSHRSSSDRRARSRSPIRASAGSGDVRDRRVYVGNLSYDVKWTNLKDFMREIGPVAHADVLLGHDGRSKGCGVVEYQNADDAKTAIRKLNDVVLMGRPVFVREDREPDSKIGFSGGKATSGRNRDAGPSRGAGGPTRQVYVGNLPYSVNWKDLKDLFRRAGAVDRADVFMNRDNRSKGSGTVSFETSHDDKFGPPSGGPSRGPPASSSRYDPPPRDYGRGNSYGYGHSSGRPSRSHDVYDGSRTGRGHDVYNGSGSTSHGDFRDSDFNMADIPSGPAAGSGDQIYIRNLPLTTTDQDLKDLFRTCGPIRMTQMLDSTGRSSGSGIVRFELFESAHKAVTKFSGYVYGGRSLEPQVIRVNLVASRASRVSVGKDNGYPIDIGTVTATAIACHRPIYDEKQELYDEEEDDGDSVLRSVATERSHSNDGIECEGEDTLEAKIKFEDMLDLALPNERIKHLEEDNKDPDMLLPTQFRWKTVYVAAFELALDTVLPEEAFLFTDEEHSLFETYRALEGLLMDQRAIDDPEEALGMLTMDELKILARRIGIAEKLSGKQRDNALLEKIVDISVFQRLHLVFNRTQEYTEKPILTGAILAKIGQRTFPSYEITRTNTVFRNRDELLKFEAAIKLHFDLSEMIESAMGPGRAATVYVRDGDQEVKSGANSNASRKSSTLKSSAKKYLETEGAGTDSKADQEEKDPEQERRRLEVMGTYEKVIQEAENIRCAWREYIATETEMSKKSPNYFLLRFSPELRAFAFLKRFEEESILLHELLDQHIYSLGKRGGWYERLALIKSNYAFQKRLGKKEALQVCMTALRDKHVHTVDATLIQARIIRLESELKVPFRDRHDFSYLTLRKAQTRILTGERLNTPGTAAPSYASSHPYSYIPNSMGSSSHPIAQQRPLWRNIDGSDCCVEELALSYYGTLGYKGHHSENSILATLFGLLFWDILFSPQPGVFETPFQTAPLDLRTDAFYLQRQEIIMDRIDNISRSKLISDEMEVCAVGATQRNCGVAVEEVLEREKPFVGEAREEEGEEEEELLINLRRQQQDAKPRSQRRLVSHELMDSVMFEKKIQQELLQDAEQYSEERQAEILWEECLARKRKECFYLDLLQKHDDLYRGKKTFCVGVNWTFTKEELLEIAECIGGPALSEICKILAQEYGKRCSGMPDLCCWDYKKKLVKFVEVKGPGDRLSSKQQVWIDLLESLGVDVELCLVQVSKDEDTFLEERNALN
ncbi:hypothetical protein BGX21_004336 [Mortierella sp. AD011]|nr:hypothetical protein BGX21_004336 [Mortierella sp. AD011]